MFNDIQIKIGLYYVNIENVKNILFKGKNASDEEIEQTLNNLISEDIKLLDVELI